jgi:hypothetical protein
VTETVDEVASLSGSEPEEPVEQSSSLTELLAALAGT